MTNSVSEYVANSRKAIIQIATLIVTLGTAVATYSALPDKYAGIVTGVVGLAGTVLHYFTPNAALPEKPTGPPKPSSPMDPRLLTPPST